MEIYDCSTQNYGVARAMVAFNWALVCRRYAGRCWRERYRSGERTA